MIYMYIEDWNSIWFLTSPFNALRNTENASSLVRIMSQIGIGPADLIAWETDFARAYVFGSLEEAFNLKKDLMSMPAYHNRLFHIIRVNKIHEDNKKELTERIITI